MKCPRLGPHHRELSLRGTQRSTKECDTGSDLCNDLFKWSRDTERGVRGLYKYIQDVKNRYIHKNLKNYPEYCRYFVTKCMERNGNAEVRLSTKPITEASWRRCAGPHPNISAGGEHLREGEQQQGQRH